MDPRLTASYQRLTIIIEDEDTGKITTFTGRVRDLAVSMNRRYDSDWSPLDIIQRGIHWVELKGEWVLQDSMYYHVMRGTNE